MSGVPVFEQLKIAPAAATTASAASRSLMATPPERFLLVAERALLVFSCILPCGTSITPELPAPRTPPPRVFAIPQDALAAKPSARCNALLGCSFVLHHPQPPEHPRWSLAVSSFGWVLAPW